MLREQAVTQRTRLDVEIAQLDEAIAKVSRRASRSGGPATQQRPAGSQRRPMSDTRQRVLSAVSERSPRRVRPVEIVQALGADPQRPPVSMGSVHNMLKALIDDGQVVRVGDGLYQLASATGPALAEADNGFSKNGAGTLSFAASPQKVR